MTSKQQRPATNREALLRGKDCWIENDKTQLPELLWARSQGNGVDRPGTGSDADNRWSVGYGCRHAGAIVGAGIRRSRGAMSLANGQTPRDDPGGFFAAQGKAIGPALPAVPLGPCALGCR